MCRPFKVSLIRDQSGASAVEFAFIAPLLITVLMAIIEFGMIMYTQTGVQNAARDVTRQLAVNKITVAQAPTKIRSLISPWLAGYETTSVQETTPSVPSTNNFTVQVKFPATYASPLQFFASVFSGFNFNVSVTMHQEDKV